MNCSSHPQLPKRMNWVPVSAHSTWSAALLNIFQRLSTIEINCLKRNCYLGTVHALSIFQKSGVCRSMEAPANMCEGRELVKGGIVSIVREITHIYLLFVEETPEARNKSLLGVYVAASTVES